jgi:molecular chaperone Hsp33
MNDQLLRFLIDDAPVRGDIVQLHATWQTVLSRHDYPPALRTALGELMAAAALLTATLKFDGSLIMQLHGNGVLKLLVVECNADLTMRATAKWGEGGDDEAATPVPDLSLRALLGHGKFVLTLVPQGQGQTYQGIVPLEGDTVAAILEAYMLRSEQLHTRLWLSADASTAAGLLLQKLPEGHGDADAWPRLQMLAGTITPAELLQLPATDTLYRLFHQEPLRLLDARPVEFQCTCSRAKVADMLRLLGEQEVGSVLAEQGSVQIHCQYCHAHYIFDPVDAAALFVPDAPVATTPTRH